MDTTTIIGTTGAAIILIAFLMNEVNRWKNSDFIYDFMNFVGSALLIIYALLLSSIPFLILNTVWGLFSLKDVIVKLSSKNKGFK
jgi:hypothetical protein